MTGFDVLPLIEELVPAPEPEDAFVRLAGLPHCLFLDSALRHPTLGRYSFLAADPFDFLQLPADGSDALGVLAARMEGFSAAALAELPPFQGGAAGLLSYDLGRSLERVPAAAVDEFGVPALAMGLYDVVVAFDHLAGRAWIVSQGLPETEPARRHRRAAERLAQMRGWLSGDGGHRGTAASEARAPWPASRDIAGASCRPSMKLPACPALPAISRSKAIWKPSSGRSTTFMPATSFRLTFRNACWHLPGTMPLRFTGGCGLQPGPMAGYFDLGAFQIVSALPDVFCAWRIAASRRGRSKEPGRARATRASTGRSNPNWWPAKRIGRKTS